MNRVLFREQELSPGGRVRLDDRRAVHILKVLKGRVGQSVRMGCINAATGTGVIEEAGARHVVLRWESDPAAPPPVRIDLLLALPRPKVLRRLWAPLASLGVGRVILTNAAKVERAYFDTHWLDPAVYEPLLVEGLEQSGDTRLPAVQICRRLKPFLEDRLDTLCPAGTRAIAHPCTDAPLSLLSPSADGRLLLAVGPEGGWTDYELALFQAHGFVPFSLGWRTLRSDVACIALLAVAHERLQETPQSRMGVQL